MAPDLHHLLLPHVTTDTQCQQPSDATRATHAPKTTQSYLLSASQESNNLWKTYTVVPGEPTKPDGQGKKKEKKKIWRKNPNVLKSNLPLEAGLAPVRAGCSELCPTKLWKFPRLNILKSLWINVLDFIALITSSGFAHVHLEFHLLQPVALPVPFAHQLPEPTPFTISTHPRQKHLYHQWTSQTQPQNWEPPKQVPPVSSDGWQSHLERLAK